MDRDDILRLAVQAGFEVSKCSNKWHILIDRFAKLVASNEKKKLLEWMDKRGYSSKYISHSNPMESLLVSLDCQIIEKWNDSLAKNATEEREECIKICKNLVKEYGAKKQAGNEIAEAIRARGQNGL